MTIAQNRPAPQAPVRHTLVAAGAPHNAEGFKMPAAWGTTAGGGHAKCSCGTVSEDLASTSARKTWHRDHKAAEQR